MADKNYNYPDSKVHGANMGPTWVLSAPDGPHVGPMNLAIRVLIKGAPATALLCNVWVHVQMYLDGYSIVV